MVLLESVEIEQSADRDHYPFNLKLVQTFPTLHFTTPITFFVGENGSGKSTIMEALALAVQVPSIGLEEPDQDTTLLPILPLAKRMKLNWIQNTHKGFFLRAEDFFNFTKRVREMREEAQKELKDLEKEYENRSRYAYMLARGPRLQTINELEKRYGVDLDANSHGESFLKVFQARFIPQGLYLLDEPEAPLSPVRQLSLISQLIEMANQGSQFIIATHSPMLMAIPNSTIWDFDQIPPRPVKYEDLEHVKLTRDFLNHPDAFLSHLSKNESDFEE